MKKENTLEKIENEKSIFVLGNDENVKKYIIKKFNELKGLDLSDEVLDFNIIEDNKEKIIGIKIGDKLIVDTLTIALVRVHQKIDEKLKEKFNNFL